MNSEYMIVRENPKKQKRPLLFVVDDDPIIRKSLERSLTANNYEVVAIADGCDVLMKLEEKTPDLIISDIRMERLDGLTLLYALRNRLETRNIPVIFMTAYAEDEIIEEARHLGASFFLTKPFPLPSLIEILKNFVPR
jgi:CheY-like chemotaxis protein